MCDDLSTADPKGDVISKEKILKCYAAIFTVLIVVFGFASLCVYAFVLQQSLSEIAESVSYAMPAFAAIAASWNAYFKKKDVALFWISGILVALGLVAFIISKRHVELVWQEFVAFYGLAATVTAYPLVRFLARNKNWDWEVISRVVAILVVALIGIQIVSIWLHHSNVANVQSELLKCEKISENPVTHHSMMDCSTVN